MEIKDWPDVPFWQEIVEKSSESTFFQAPHWHEIIVKTFQDYSIATKGFIFDDGSKAVFPLMKTRSSGFLRSRVRLRSSAFRGYGGILSERPLLRHHQDQIYSHLMTQKASIFVDCNPFSQYKLPSVFKKKKSFTQVFMLDRSIDEVCRALNRGAKSNLKQAQKKGVTVRTASSEHDIAVYFSMYQDAIKRWGAAAIYIFPEELFYNIFKILKKAGDEVKLWLAEKDGTIIAGAVVFYCNQIVSYWHGASLQQYFNCYPNNLLHVEIIKDAITRQYRYYDLGKSGGQEGVVKFKKSLGAKELSCITGHWKYRRRDSF